MNDFLDHSLLKCLSPKRLQGISPKNEEGGVTVDLMRSGLVTVTLLAVVVGGIVFLYHERGRGNLTRLQNHIQPHVAQSGKNLPMPGGQEAIVLTRGQMMAGSTPQFLSATLLPGRGMNLLQLTAYLPGKGEIPLLASPELKDAAQMLTDAGPDANGALSLQMGAPIELPWAGSLLTVGRTASGPSNGQVESGLVTMWHGQPFTIPGPVTRSGGLLLDRAASSAQPNTMPDGGEIHGVFHAADFGSRWPSSTDVETTILLSGRVMELTITAKNVGTQPEPMGIGWRPRFILPSGDRSQVRLLIPALERVETAGDAHRNSGVESGIKVPTGRLLPVEGTPYDLREHGGKPLPAGDIDTTFTNLQTGFLDSGPIFELVDPAASYGLRITTLTTRIKAIHVTAPADGRFIALSPQFNLDDPFGREWPKDTDTGMTVLAPGETAEWRLRLELFDPNAQTLSPLPFASPTATPPAR